MSEEDIIEHVNETTPLDEDGTHPMEHEPIEFSHRAHDHTMGIDGEEHTEHAIHSAAAVEHAMSGNSREAAGAHIAAAEAHQHQLNTLPENHEHLPMHQTALDAHLEAANQHTESSMAPSTSLGPKGKTRMARGDAHVLSKRAHAATMAAGYRLGGKLPHDAYAANALKHSEAGHHSDAMIAHELASEMHDKSATSHEHLHKTLEDEDSRTFAGEQHRLHREAQQAHKIAAKAHDLEYNKDHKLSLVEFGSGEGFKAYRLGLDDVVYVHDDGKWEHHDLAIQESDEADKATNKGTTKEELTALMTRLAKEKPLKPTDEEGEEEAEEEAEDEAEAEETDENEPMIVEEEEPENPDAVDPGVNEQEEERKLQAIMSRLPQFGINLPSDTDCCNFVDRLLTAMMTAEATENLIAEESQSANPEEEEDDVDNYKEASPAFAAMSLKAQAAHNFAEQMHRQSIVKRLDDLEKSGRCTPTEAKAKKTEVEKVRLSLDTQGKPRKSTIEQFLEDRESLPAGAAWKSEERLRMAGVTEAPLNPAIVGHDVDNMTPEEADKWSEEIVNEIYGRKRFPQFNQPNGQPAGAK